MVVRHSLSFGIGLYWYSGSGNLMGIWSHERYISVESEVGSLQSTDALSGHADVTLA